MGLIYLKATNRYLCLWQTSLAWHHSCRFFTMTLTDGTSHSAEFSFR